MLCQLKLFWTKKIDFFFLSLLKNGISANFLIFNSLLDRSIDWLIDLVRWLAVDWLIDLVRWLAVDWLIGWLVGQVVFWFHSIVLAFSPQFKPLLRSSSEWMEPDFVVHFSLPPFFRIFFLCEREKNNPASSYSTIWSVTDPTSGNVCVLASFNASLTVSYPATNAKTNATYVGSASLTVPSDASVVVDRSFCSTGTANKTQSVTVSWPAATGATAAPFNLTLVFDAAGVAVLAFQYDLSDTATFSDASPTNASLQTAEIDRSGFIPIPANTYLQCRTGADETLLNTVNKAYATVVMATEGKLAAFRMSKTMTFDGPATVCPGDLASSTTAEPSTTEGPASSTTTAMSSTERYSLLDVVFGCLWRRRPALNPEFCFAYFVRLVSRDFVFLLAVLVGCIYGTLSIKQSINWSINQCIINQSINPSCDQSINPCIINQSIKQSINQSIDRWSSIRAIEHQFLRIRLCNQPINQTNFVRENE